MSAKPLTLFGLATLATLLGCGAEERGADSGPAADSATLNFLAQAGEASAQAELGYFNSQYPSLGGLVGLPAPTRPAALADALLGALLPASSRVAPGAASPFSQCIPVLTGVDSTGHAIDSDGDGIPDDLTLDLGDHCVSEDSAGTFRVTSSGSVRIQDTGLGFIGFLLTLDHLKVVTENLVSGTVNTGTMDGTESGRFTATLAERGVALTVSDRVVSNGTVFEDTAVVSRHAAYRPDAGGTLTLGGLLPAGRMDFDADIHVINGFQGRSFDVTFGTPTSLHYAPGCGSQLDAGMMRGLMDGGTTTGLELRWSGCAAPALTLFGNIEGQAESGDGGR